MTTPIDYQGMVTEFHEKFGHVVNKNPTLKVSPEIKLLRAELIREELEEFETALAADDIVEVADALADILYVTFGAAIVFGLPMDRIFEVVQQSNMSKLGEDGKPIYREDGKVLKGPNFFEPQRFIEALLTGESTQYGSDIDTDGF